MKLSELKAKVSEYQYFEDTNIIDISIASIVSTRLKLGDPIWLILIGPSSSGKSQILRPLALTDPKFLHRVDDVTENTFLSGAQGGGEKSLLKRIGSQGMMVISDFTVIFSKSPETRAAVLSQFRMIYDGEMSKSFGNSDKPVEWKGYLGVLAGSTPSIYAKFEEVSDMGERFIYYRMKPYDSMKAMKMAMERKVFGTKLDVTLAESYDEYIKEVVKNWTGEEIVLSDLVKERIFKIAHFAEIVRTTQHTDWKGTVDRMPVPAMPMRVALQLMSIAKALTVIRHHEGGSPDLREEDIHMIEWCGYSLANEEKRAVMRILAKQDFEVAASTSTIADRLGLSTDVTSVTLQNLASVGILTRSASMDGGLTWCFTNKEDHELVRNVEGINTTENMDSRISTDEEKGESSRMVDAVFESF